GKVEIELSLTAEGRVSAARVLQSSGHELLDQTTLAALRQWRFRPATRDGVPVASLFRQVVTWVIAAAGGR
ncbi:MAG TPA: energy transducer TonB, partial [Planctomycetota bacterium]|nr:energy transducer TonB [Planctomycetota bacterium]